MKKILRYSCPACGKNFRNTTKLINHLRLNGSEYFIPKVVDRPEDFINEVL